MQKGVVVLTGTSDLGIAAGEFPALFRRVACVCEIGVLNQKEISEYFVSFLRKYVQLTEDAWAAYVEQFSAMATDDKPWSIDSLQQYLMKRLTLAADRKILECLTSAGSAKHQWTVRAGQKDALLEVILDSTACSYHLQNYAVAY